MLSMQGALQLCLNGWVQQFFPALRYRNAFWVLPVCTGMRCSCVPFLTSALLLHGEETSGSWPSGCCGGHQQTPLLHNHDTKILWIYKKMFLLFNLNMLFYPSLQFHLAMSLPKSIIIEVNAAEHELKMRPFNLKTECESSVHIQGNLK